MNLIFMKKYVLAMNGPAHPEPDDHSKKSLTLLRPGYLTTNRPDNYGK